MIKRFQLKSEFSRNVLTLMTGTAIAQAIPIAISPILTRIYTPEDFGLFALYMAIVSILAVMATGRYELAIMLPKKEEDAFQIMCLASAITIAISALILLIVAVFNYEITIQLQNPEISVWLYLVPFSVLVSGLYQSLNYWHNRNKRYVNIATNRIIQSGGTSLTQVGLGLALPPAGLILGQQTGQILSLSYFIKTYFKKDHNQKQFKFLKVKALARRYAAFPKIDVPTTLINISANQLPNILLAALFSGSSVGFYYLTQRVLQAPITLISGSVLDVFKQRASSDYKKNGHCKDIFQKTFWALLLMALPPSLILYFWIEDLFAFVFGEVWREAGVYSQLLIPAMFFRFMANPLSFMFYLAEKQIWNLMGMTGLLVLVIISFYYSKDVYQLMALLSAVYSIVYLFYVLFSFILSCGLFKKGKV
jgi:O-antigen/teichoic acid export membrane protein